MSSIAAPIMDTFSSEGSKAQSRRAGRTAKQLKGMALQEFSRGAPLRQEVTNLAMQAVQDPRAAARRLNPFSAFAAETLGGQLGRQRINMTDELVRAGVGLGQPGAANALFARDVAAAQAINAARLSPIQQLFGAAPGISGMGVSEGFGGMTNAGQIQLARAQIALQRAEQQSQAGGEIFGILGGVAGS